MLDNLVRIRDKMQVVYKHGSGYKNIVLQIFQLLGKTLQKTYRSLVYLSKNIPRLYLSIYHRRRVRTTKIAERKQ